MKLYSLWLGRLEDLAAGSSPTTASTPPFGLVPAKFACRIASPDRSSPGALPYQSPNTPSTRAPGKRFVC
ncbi:MAG TPA: hypothetical protein DDW95_12615 [Alphaproteobacteria bacterium]|nr:hypothetical protein [Alphaproteobacteria bacterium]HAM48866.1 hypothetical protein [Alphaproteobacteria bacterium]HBA41767.1 hypothetical protein [Alphaproteobacteria bacterium]HBF99386.1 hypothetical protein [Alphaproteobacteria bacterium]